MFNWTCTCVLSITKLDTALLHTSKTCETQLDKLLVCRGLSVWLNTFTQWLNDPITERSQPQLLQQLWGTVGAKPVTVSNSFPHIWIITFNKNRYFNPLVGVVIHSFLSASYLGDFSKLCVSLATLLRCLHSQFVVIHKCSVDSKLAGLMEREEKQRRLTYWNVGQ